MDAFSSQAMLMEDFFPLEYESMSFLRFIQKWKKYGSAFMLLKQPSKVSELSRPYVSGDALSHIDWKAFARTDQLIVREEREESQQKIVFFLDASDSMFFPEKNEAAQLYNQQEPCCQKIDLAVRILIHLAGSHLKSSDKVQIFLIKDNDFFSEKNMIFSPKNLQDLFDFYHITRDDAYSNESIKSFFTSQNFSKIERDLSYLLSDGFFFQENAKKDFFIPSSEIAPTVFFHILSQLEQDFSWIESAALYHEMVSFDDQSKKMQGIQMLNQQFLSKQVQKWQKLLEKKIEDNLWLYMPLTEKTGIPSYFSFLDSFFIRR